MMLPIDGVILDFHMPGMNGHNVAAAIKKCRPDIRIVMFSGSEIPEETCDLVDAVVLKTDAIAQLVGQLHNSCNRAWTSGVSVDPPAA